MRWLVSALVLLEVTLLVLSQQEVTTDAVLNEQAVTEVAQPGQTNQAPTRLPTQPGAISTLPPLIHSALNASEPTGNTTGPKSAAPGFSCHSLPVVAVLSVFAFGAIL